MVESAAVTCPPGASPDEASGVCGGTGRCWTCLAANARQSGRRAARALGATSRSRANGGDSSTAIALRRAGHRAGLANSRACSWQQAVARGLVR